MDKQQVIFATYKDGELQGFRADSFGTLSKDYPKIYGYTPEQVQVVLDNVKSELNRAGSTFFKVLSGKNTVAISTQSGEEIAMDSVIDRVAKQEDKLRQLGEFEVRVIPFTEDRTSWYGLGEGDEWKRKQILDNLPEPLEVHKFRTVDNEN
jgi:hypothetical protein